MGLEASRTFHRIKKRIAMRDLSSAHHATENRAKPRVRQHLFSKGDEYLVNIVLRRCRRDTVYVCGCHAKRALIRNGFDLSLSLLSEGIWSGHKLHSSVGGGCSEIANEDISLLRRVPYSFDSTLRRGGRMTIRSGLCWDETWHLRRCATLRISKPENISHRVHLGA